MITVYLVDYLGVHCGMHYYLEAFKKILSNIPNVEPVILSNYSEKRGAPPFFYNQYNGNLVNKGLSFLRNVWKLKRFIRNNQNGVYIYLTYGNRIDIPFINIVSKAKNYLVDIHEAIAQDVDSDIKLRKKFQMVYKNRVKGVISHSSRTDLFLGEYGFGGISFEVPHFKYVFPKYYTISNIPFEILNAPERDRLNLLFFGNLNESKGVDVLMESINILPMHIADRINLIIAGKDFDGTIDKVQIQDGKHVKIFKRHISDDELRFLYQNVDFIMLPYRKTSQSGILEMAFYFKKPIIASDIPYFRNMLSKFPSFGLIAGNTSRSFSDTIEKVVFFGQNNSYFIQQDWDRYNNRIEINKFVHDFSDWVNKVFGNK